MTETGAAADIVVFCVVVVGLYFASESALASSMLDLVPRSLRLPAQSFAMAQVAVVAVLALAARDADMARSLGVARVDVGRAIGVGLFLWTAIIGLAISFAFVIVGARVLGGALVAAPSFGATPDDTRLMRELAHIDPLVLVPLACFVGFYEELLFRGFLLGRLRALFGSGGAGAFLSIALSSLLFALGHTYKSGIGIFATFLIGVILGVASWRSNSIWSCVLAHAMIDTMALVGARYAVGGA